MRITKKDVDFTLGYVNKSISNEGRFEVIYGKRCYSKYIIEIDGFNKLGYQIYEKRFSSYKEAYEYLRGMLDILYLNNI